MGYHNLQPCPVDSHGTRYVGKGASHNVPPCCLEFPRSLRLRHTRPCQQVSHYLANMVWFTRHSVTPFPSVLNPTIPAHYEEINGITM